ncbi:MAG: hypothetical protein GY754_10860 [bacterium]|nr:hypothetical protein [bacterium]
MNVSEALKEFFLPRFSEAIKIVAKHIEFDTIQERETFKNEDFETIGRDLDGYSLEDIAFDYIEESS